MTPEDTEQTYRLSPAQEWILTAERLRFLRGMQLVKVLRLPDGIGHGQGRRVVAELFRHETALRTCIERHGGRFRQRIIAAEDLSVPHSKAGNAAHAVAALSEVMAAELAEPVDPRCLPARATMLSAGPRLRLLILAAHHVVADWWAMEVAASEAVALAGAARPEPDRYPVTFAQYADQLAAQSGRSDEYWAATLSGAEPLRFPADRPSAGVGSTTSNLVRENIGRAEDVRRMAGQARATAFAVLLSAFAVVLHGRTGQDDILVNTQLANRGRPELQRLVGCLTTTVPLRLDTSGGGSFASLAAAAQRALGAAYRHGQIDFGRVLRACGLLADPRLMMSPSVLFQMIPAEAGAGLRLPPNLDAVARPGIGLPLDLHVGVSVSDGRLRCEVEFNDNVIDAATVTGLVDEFSEVVRVAGTSVSSPVDRIGAAASARTAPRLRRKAEDYG
jgi:hypothetical protein